MKWRQVKLGEVCEFKYGKSLVKETRVEDGPYPVYGSSGIVGHHNEYVVDGPCLVVGRKGSIGSVFFSEQPCYPIDTAYFVHCKEEMNLRFLYYQLSTLRLNELNKAAAIPGLNREDAYRKVITLPPLDVQQRIADTLDTADALRRKDQELMRKYDELAQSIFYEMFGDPEHNTEGWEVQKFGSLIHNIKAGTSLGGEDRELNPGEFGVLKISAVTTGIFKPQEYKVPVQSDIVKERVTVKKGDLLFSRANTRELVGAVAIVEDTYPALMLPDKLWRIDLHTDQMLNYYCKAILTDKSVRYTLTQTATGSSGSMLNISMGKLRDLEIPVPPLGLQEDFEEVSKKLLTQKRLVEKAAAQSEGLFNSLLGSHFA